MTSEYQGFTLAFNLIIYRTIVRICDGSRPEYRIFTIKSIPEPSSRKRQALGQQAPPRRVNPLELQTPRTLAQTAFSLRKPIFVEDFGCFRKKPRLSTKPAQVFQAYP